MPEDASKVTLSVEQSRSIPAGEHEGRIAAVSLRDSGPWPYVDVDIDLHGDDGSIITTLTAGYPARITPRTNLGSLLSRFGVAVEKLAEDEAEIDISEVLSGEPVIFETKDVHSENGTFAEIIPESVSPAPESAKLSEFEEEE